VGLRAELTGRILRLGGVELRRSRFTGDEAFFAGPREIAHFHGEDVLDVRLTRARLRALGDALRADPRATLRPGSDWCAFAFAGRADLDRATELVAEALSAHR
jgi:hypothetical protein